MFNFTRKERFEKRQKKNQNDPKPDQKIESPSQAAWKYFTGTFLKGFHHPK